MRYKNLILYFPIIFILLGNSIVDAQSVVGGPKAYFGHIGLDSMKRSDLLNYDTLKSDNPKLKIVSFYIALSNYDCSTCTNDVSLYKVEGSILSKNKTIFDILKKNTQHKIWLTVQNIEFINSQGKHIQYPRDFSFKIFE